MTVNNDELEMKTIEDHKEWLNIVADELDRAERIGIGYGPETNIIRISDKLAKVISARLREIAGTM